ncbi:N-acetylglucosamine-6-phosphate deacetylase [Microlunatus panaciterrae]|uniref:N-acetylglucosamine-6-phosphate deacetylase n=1 Tax=Microlunatus panaciterrae TaxID=400768 RepID=A0ABS2RGP0_9ACTN|nr:N-acetylglucosamine-6-phosphate deacetylase [Microlunatus panaciterrae]MBM7798174.1 N-acetylglucosamine-6-phosphate deacetylase [Microlunatus panaciterrae]
MSEQRFRVEHLLTEAGDVGGGTVTVADGRIVDLSEGAPDAEALDGWLVPGFVDTHVHGGGGADFATTDPAEALRALDYHRRHGTTTSFASLVTVDIDTLCDQIETLVPLVRQGEIAGIHLEGPFLSSAKCGAHDPSLLRLPQPHLLDRVLTSGQGHIAMVTIAPELPGALAAIERLSHSGVVAALGHTDGDEQAIAAGIAAGGTVATHLFNAMRSIHHRTPGPVPRLLTDPLTIVELICDGTHLHSDVIAMAIAAAGPDRVALITDAMVAAGMADGHYRLGALNVQVEDGVARLVGADGQPGSIAGSTLTMAGAFAFLVTQVGISIPDAARMAAKTPARAHGLAEVGQISVGNRADFCLVDDHGSLLRVMRRGVWLDRSDDTPTVTS